MKIRLSFKTPDVGDEAVKEAKEDLRYHYLAEHGVDSITDLSPEQEDELEECLGACQDEIEEVCEKWLSYGECITVELDTTSGAAEVLPATH